MAVFIDRFDAGRKLSRELKKFSNLHPIVLAIPRGGVEVGYEIAKTLGFALDVIVSRKIGAPSNPEYGIGAVSESALYINEEAFDKTHISDAELFTLVQKEKEEVKRRVKLYRLHSKLSIKHRTVILVDDGLATGATAIAAVLSIKMHTPKQLILATPVALAQPSQQLKPLVDEFISLEGERVYNSVSSFYKHFNQVSDATVIKLLFSLIPN